MTQVAFHFNATDKWAYACRLLRKAYLRRARLVVLAGHRQDAALDRSLWSLSDGEFVPHCLASADPGIQKRSPILIAATEPPPGFGAEVLVNLCAEMPPDYARFERVIEIVDLSQGDREHARMRWRQYQASGISPQRHDLNAPPSNPDR